MGYLKFWKTLQSARAVNDKLFLFIPNVLTPCKTHFNAQLTVTSIKSEKEYNTGCGGIGGEICYRFNCCKNTLHIHQQDGHL